MKDLSYGKGYKYAHDEEDAVADMKYSSGGRFGSLPMNAIEPVRPTVTAT